jgi:hypothetical protein
MSQEVFELVQGMDLKSTETQIALQCAPLISGLKVSNLLIISAEDEALVRVILRRSGISFFRLLRTGEKVTFLLFRKNPLEAYLKQQEVETMLVEAGYAELSLGNILSTFQKRYAHYMSAGGRFPHEMGLLLGYPAEDVKGFVENEGKNFLYSGYWKVYADVEEKRRLFQKFENAKETVIQLLSYGVGIQDILDIYKDENEPKQAAV